MVCQGKCHRNCVIIWSSGPATCILIYLFCLIYHFFQPCNTAQSHIHNTASFYKIFTHYLLRPQRFPPVVIKQAKARYLPGDTAPKAIDSNSRIAQQRSPNTDGGGGGGGRREKRPWCFLIELKKIISLINSHMKRTGGITSIPTNTAKNASFGGVLDGVASSHWAPGWQAKSLQWAKAPGC